MLVKDIMNDCDVELISQILKYDDNYPIYANYGTHKRCGVPNCELVRDIFNKIMMEYDHIPDYDKKVMYTPFMYKIMNISDSIKFRSIPGTQTIYWSSKVCELKTSTGIEVIMTPFDIFISNKCIINAKSNIMNFHILEIGVREMYENELLEIKKNHKGKQKLHD